MEIAGKNAQHLSHISIFLRCRQPKNAQQTHLKHSQITVKTHMRFTHDFATEQCENTLRTPEFLIISKRHGKYKDK